LTPVNAARKGSIASAPADVATLQNDAMRGSTGLRDGFIVHAQGLLAQIP